MLNGGNTALNNEKNGFDHELLWEAVVKNWAICVCEDVTSSNLHFIACCHILTERLETTVWKVHKRIATLPVVKHTRRRRMDTATIKGV